MNVRIVKLNADGLQHGWLTEKIPLAGSHHLQATSAVTKRLAQP